MSRVRLTSRNLLVRGLDLRSNVVAGAAANTNIAVPNIRRADHILSVIEHPGPGEAAGQAVVDRTPQTTIHADGAIRVSVATNASADRRLVVTWVKV